MKKYSVILNESNKESVLGEYANRILFSRFAEKDGSMSFSTFQKELKYADIEKWATDGTEVHNVPIVIEVNPNLLDNNVPNNPLFKNRSTTDEEGNVTVKKVNEYFRTEQIGERAFVQLAGEPMTGNGNLKIESFFSSLEVVDLISTFGGAIINKYSEAEYKALRSTLQTESES